MAHDLLDPGPDHNGQPAYLNWPRDVNGTPCFADTHSAAEVVFPSPGGQPVRRGTVSQRGALVDLTHYSAEGIPLVPPTIPLDVVRQMFADYYG